MGLQNKTLAIAPVIGPAIPAISGSIAKLIVLLGLSGVGAFALEEILKEFENKIPSESLSSKKEFVGYLTTQKERS